MRQVLVSGTGTRARIPGYDLAGKTGTTSDYRDAWFIGFTGGFVTAVWMGKDDNTPMRKITGGTLPADVWRAFMVQALPRLAVHTIPSGPNPPPGAVYGDPIGDLLNKGTDVIGAAIDNVQGPAPAPAPTPGPAPVPTPPPRTPPATPAEAPLF
jgi:penicillin-binding protein 1A